MEQSNYNHTKSLGSHRFNNSQLSHVFQKLKHEDYESLHKELQQKKANASQTTRKVTQNSRYLRAPREGSSTRTGLLSSRFEPNVDWCCPILMLVLHIYDWIVFISGANSSKRGKSKRRYPRYSNINLSGRKKTKTSKRECKGVNAKYIVLLVFYKYINWL